MYRGEWYILCLVERTKANWSILHRKEEEI